MACFYMALKEGKVCTVLKGLVVRGKRRGGGDESRGRAQEGRRGMEGSGDILLYKA